MRLFLPKKNKGQLLIEVVVAVGITTLLSVALLSAVSISIKNSRVAKDRTIAVELAQEGIELMRTYRDYSWPSFSARATGDDWRLVENWGVEDDLESGCDETVMMSDDPDSNFRRYSRCVNLTEIRDAGDVVAVDVLVTLSWNEGDQIKEVAQSTRLSIWER